MMSNRKCNHPDVIKTCKRYLKNTCAFEDDICWYSHTLKEMETSKTSATCVNTYECKFCKNIFGSKEEFMRHRKEKHPQVVKNCREALEGSCRFSNEECWYHHDLNTNSNQEKDHNLGFYKNQNMHPPDQDDIMQRIMTLMEQLTARVYKLENPQKI